MRSAAGAIATAILMGAMAMGQSTPAPEAPATPQASPASPVAPGDEAQTQAEKDTAREKARAAREKARAAREKARESSRAELARKAGPNQVWRIAQAGSYLGVDIRDVTPEQVGQLKLKSDSGVEITMVDQDAPAGKAGLKEHDVITSFNGQQVESTEQLRRLIRETPAGRTIALGVMRDGQPVNLNVTLGTRQQVFAWSGSGPGRAFATIPPIPPMPAMPQTWEFDVPQISVLQFWGRNGLVVEDLTPQLGEFFGVRNGEGVLVRSVEKGSTAAEAGLKAGDVITKVNGDRVSSSSDWRRVMRQQRSGAVSVNIIRDKRAQTLSMKLPERKTSNSSIRIVVPDVSPALENMNKELERMAPQIERAAELAQAQAMRDVERNMREVERELERATRELEKVQIEDENEQDKQPEVEQPPRLEHKAPTPQPATPPAATPPPQPPPTPQSF